MSDGNDMFLFCLIAIFFVAIQDIRAEEYTLLDAVKATLKNQPAIRIQEQQKEVVAGQLQQAEGAFDTSFGASITASDNEMPGFASENL